MSEIQHYSVVIFISLVLLGELFIFSRKIAHERLNAGFRITITLCALPFIIFPGFFIAILSGLYESFSLRNLGSFILYIGPALFYVFLRGKKISETSRHYERSGF